MIRLAQLYTGGVGSEIIRRLAGHPQLELVGVLVHGPEKSGRDSGAFRSSDSVKSGLECARYLSLIKS